MTDNQIEIFTKTQSLSQELEQIYSSGTFELNKRVNEIFKEMSRLQENCEHEFVNGQCKICGKVEKKND